MTVWLIIQFSDILQVVLRQTGHRVVGSACLTPFKRLLQAHKFLAFLQAAPRSKEEKEPHDPVYPPGQPNESPANFVTLKTQAKCKADHPAHQRGTQATLLGVQHLRVPTEVSSTRQGKYTQAQAKTGDECDTESKLARGLRPLRA